MGHFVKGGHTLWGRRLASYLRLAVLTLAVLVVLPGQARADCHQADITPKQITVSESTNEIEFTVTILGSGTYQCEGRVAYETVNGSAKAGSDFKETHGQVSFSPVENQRSKKFKVMLIDNLTHEPQETFIVRIKTHPEHGGIHPVPDPNPATVRINDNDPAPSPTPTATRTSASPSPTPTATVTPTASPTESVSPSPSPSPTDTPTPFPTETDTGLAAPPDDGGGGGGAIAAIVVALILLVGGGGLWLLRRRYGFR